MDKTWMTADRRSQMFGVEVDQFLKFSSDNARGEFLPCPCLKCCNMRYSKVDVIKDHIYINGIMPNYTRWIWHGKCSAAAAKLRNENPHLGSELDEDEGCSEDSDEFTDVEDLKHLPVNLPFQLRILCNWANQGLRDGATILTNFPAELFGHPTKAVISRADIFAMAHMAELGRSSVLFYMSHLSEVLKKSRMTDMIGFVDPNCTRVLGNRSKNLMNRFKAGTDGQIYFPSQNSGGIKIYYAQKTNKPTRLILVQWIPLLGAPQQIKGKTSAYWVMRYMKDIVEDEDMEFASNWKSKQGLQYTERKIDQVRSEWAKRVAMFKASRFR